MSLLRSRDRFSNKGLGNLEVREISPTVDAAFSNLGYLEESGFQDIVEHDELKDENGNVIDVLESTRAQRLTTKLMQVSANEMNYIRAASGKKHAIRYSGMANPVMFQYYCSENGKILNKLDRGMKRGPQNIPFEYLALHQDSLGYDVPEFFTAEAQGRIRTENLQLWINLRAGNAYNAATARVLDISGFARHGLLNSDFASIWQTGTTPERSLLFDGVNDGLDFGNILNDDATSDLLFEIWVKILTADGSGGVLFSKKAGYAAVAPGYVLYREAATNIVTFLFADGTNTISLGTSATVLRNVWNHFAVAIDRNGLATLYRNGVSNAYTSIAATTSATCTDSLYISRLPTLYGNTENGMFRVYNYGAGGLPADIATIPMNHYNAEKSYYGL